MKTFLKRLKTELNNPLINKKDTIVEIKKQKKSDLLDSIVFQLESPTFLKEWCINEIEIEIKKIK